MYIFRSIDEIKVNFFRPALTIGNFDGVHLGHQALFQKVVEIAGPRAGDTIALTFEPHPLKVLRPDSPPKLICTFDHKVELIKKAGIEYVLCLKFDHKLASTPAKDFVKRVLVEAIGVEDLVVGYDYAFGKGRQGNREFLKAAGEKFGFKVHVMDPVTIDGIIVSSSKVRELVQTGRMRMVQRLLGRFYQIRGVVQEGKRRGGPVVGYPTANLIINKDDLCPMVGVYCVQVLIGKSRYGGVMNIGYNPTFEETGLLGAEVHIFEFHQDIYGRHIKVDLIERIRGEKKFSGPEALRKQISKDIEKAHKILSREADSK